MVVMVSRYALLHNVVVVSANMAWQVSHCNMQCKQWSFKRRSKQRFVITEKALARAFSWLKAPNYYCFHI